MIRYFMSVILAAGFVTSAYAADTPRGYLDGLKPAYVPPPPPAPGSLVDQMDLVMVRAALPAPGSTAFQEAAADAKAYPIPAILPRFDAAAGTALKAAERPILADLIGQAADEGGKAIRDYKRLNPRNRPYVGNPDIAACQKDLREWESYPSGHAAHGMIVALVLADIFPDHTQDILARGVLYGDRRVVCGVHHPIDVTQARMVALSYMSAARVQEKYKAQLACAKHEDAVLRKAEPALPDDCKAMIPAK